MIRSATSIEFLKTTKNSRHRSIERKQKHKKPIKCRLRCVKRGFALFFIAQTSNGKPQLKPFSATLQGVKANRPSLRLTRNEGRFFYLTKIIHRKYRNLTKARYIYLLNLLRKLPLFQLYLFRKANKTHLCQVQPF